MLAFRSFGEPGTNATGDKLDVKPRQVVVPSLARVVIVPHFQQRTTMHDKDTHDLLEHYLAR